MSGEFRWCSSSYLYAVLENLDEAGDHPVSKALTKLYKALAPVERDCAWVEAADSGPARAAMGLYDNWPLIEEAFKELKALRNEYGDLIEMAFRAKEQEIMKKV